MRRSGRTWPAGPAESGQEEPSAGAKYPRTGAMQVHALFGILIRHWNVLFSACE